MSRSRVVFLLGAAALVAAYFVFDLGQYLQFELLKAERDHLAARFTEHPATTLLAFFAIYVAVTGLSLPGAAVLTLAAGAIFGLLWGVLVVSFASTLGATLAFLLARYLFRDPVQRRFGDRLKPINEGFARDGAFYLLTLRLVPAFPFFVVNLLLALTPISTRTFYLVSQLGMLPATVIFVNAGTELGRIDTLSGIFSAPIVISLSLLGIFPLAARKAVTWLRARRILRRFPPPRRYDRNVIVIGAGSAGLVTAYIAAAGRAKVSLIERDRMGGDCLNTGCVPSKTLIRSAKQAHLARHGARYGLRDTPGEVDFKQVMDRVHAAIKTIEPHDSVARYTALGVDCIAGEARIVSPYEVEVNGRRLTTRSIVLATGARPLIPSLPGLDRIDYLTSDNLWALRELPPRLLVLGGGPIGCELGQAFARLGSQVTIVGRAPRLLPREDPEFSALLAQHLDAEGLVLKTGHQPLAVEAAGAGGELVCSATTAADSQPVRIGFDKLLIAVGRKPNVEGYGLEALGVSMTKSGTVETNEFLQTSFPNIYACGDLVGPYQFTHAASHQAWYAACNSLLGGIKRFAVDYSVLPWCTFTDPEIARVGLSEEEAKQRGIACEVHRFAIDELDRAIADGAAYGVVKVLTKPGSDRILGAAIAAERAGDMIAEMVLAMRCRLGLSRILGTVHTYPTWMEANKFAAGVWRRSHTPARLLALATRFHAWRRGE